MGNPRSPADRHLRRPVQIIWLCVIALVAGMLQPGDALAQKMFTKTYQLGGSFTLSCCSDGYMYGFTTIDHDASLTGEIKITSIAVSMHNSVSMTDKLGNAGASWQIYIGPTSPGFPVGQRSAPFVTYSTYPSSEPAQLEFYENDKYQAGQSNTLTGQYNFTTNAFSTNSDSVSGLISEQSKSIRRQGRYLRADPSLGWRYRVRRNNRRCNSHHHG